MTALISPRLRLARAVVSTLILVAGLMAGAPPAAAAPAVLDDAFNNALPTGLDNFLQSVTWDGSGYVISGGFTNGPGGTSQIFRVHQNGTPDATFNGNIAKGLNGAVYSVAWDGNGYVIGGNFTNGPNSTSRFFRVNRDGQSDSSFNGIIPHDLGSTVVSVVWDGSGYVISGVFTNGPGTGVGHKRVFRVRRNGTLDATFNDNLPTGLNDMVYSVTWDGSGYVIGGVFTNGPDGTRNLFRVGQDGIPDATFNGNIPAGLNSNVYSVTWDGSGYVVGGQFTNGPDGTRRIFRVGKDGAEDAAFNGNLVQDLDQRVLSVAWDGSGYLIGGAFSNGPDGTVNLFRVHRDGSPDTEFNQALPKTLNDFVYSVAWDGSGHVIGGIFTNGPGTGVGHKRVFRMANLAPPALPPGSLKVKGGPTAKTYKITWKEPAGTGAIRPVSSYRLTVKAKRKSLLSKTLSASKPKVDLKRKTLLKLIKKKKVKKAKVHKLTAEISASNPVGKGPVARKAFKMRE